MHCDTCESVHVTYFCHDISACDTGEGEGVGVHCCFYSQGTGLLSADGGASAQM
jgi:hypothetical protein